MFADQRPENPIKNFPKGPDITSQEVESTLQQMKKSKAMGIDNIPTESLQALGGFGTKQLTKICNQMYRSAEIPEDLRTSIFIVLPKKPRATECSDHRTISLMCHTLKLLLLIILKRITNKINVNVGPEQAGFRKYSGTREGIFNLRLITEKYLEKQKDIYACFIHYSKAFDTAKHQELLQCLKTTDIEENDIALIANVYWQQKTIVKINNDISEPLKIEKGVRQCCVLSPALFNLYTDIIFRNIDQRPGIKIGGHTINNLRYADDTVLLAENESELQQILDTVKTQLRGFEMWMYRRIGRVSWKAKKTNKEVLNKLGLQSTKLMTVVRQRIVRFYGHVRRHDSLQRIITEGMVNGKRGRGRKRCGWLGNVSRYAGMNINRCAEIATNREEWRTIVSNVVSDKEQR